ncbi:hypothetical protein L1987_35336 [Smallanthus sonchifolius]|uniref:Uncharacterized protein n=1 Tax=Smallanthus sonchifolius TaxID=185202 RepID=A0ACB9HWB1_9ASTR|nr:hypothetical protein L1987_35336 [Smallanthus sonchifolius]
MKCLWLIDRVNLWKSQRPHLSDDIEKRVDLVMNDLQVDLGKIQRPHLSDDIERRVDSVMNDLQSLISICKKMMIEDESILQKIVEEELLVTE